MKKRKTASQRLRDVQLHNRDLGANHKSLLEIHGQHMRAYAELDKKHQSVMKLILEERKRVAERLALLDSLLELGGGWIDDSSPSRSRYE